MPGIVTEKFANNWDNPTFIADHECFENGLKNCLN
jgi:hypothetical protein